MLYPSELYITASGEGHTLKDAEDECLSKISMYFDISTDYSSHLESIIKEVDGANYSVSKSKSSSESVKVSSKADFLCVQFEKSFKAGKTHHAFAYIERDSAFKVYEKRIEINSAILESLLVVAENYNNPVAARESSKKAIPVAELVEQEIKIASLIQKVPSSYFLNSQALCQRARTAFEVSSANLIFLIKVENDLEGEIKRTVSKLLEGEGYAVSETDGVCVVDCGISWREENLPAGVFLYGGITVKVVSGSGETIFTWSRNIPKTGAPKGMADAAKKLMFQKIVKELEKDFMEGFKQKIKN